MKSRESKTIRIVKGLEGKKINLGEDQEESEENQEAPTINTALEAVADYAVQLKGRAKDGEIRGVITFEFGVNPAEGGIRQAGAVSTQEAALAVILFQQMIVGGAMGEAKK